MNAIHLGRLLRANTRGCVAGCQVNQPLPAFGSMVRIFLDQDLHAYGIITDIHIDDDGLVRQLAVNTDVPDEIIEDNRQNRNVPVELSVLFIGHSRNEVIFHLLPSKPPLSLDDLYSCGPEEIRKFISAGRLGYLRHILGAEDIPIADTLAAHLTQAGEAQKELDGGIWLRSAVQEVITLLRDDHAALSAVLGAVADAFPAFAGSSQFTKAGGSK